MTYWVHFKCRISKALFFLFIYLLIPRQFRQNVSNALAAHSGRLRAELLLVYCFELKVTSGHGHTGHPYCAIYLRGSLNNNTFKPKCKDIVEFQHFLYTETVFQPTYTETFEIASRIVVFWTRVFYWNGWCHALLGAWALLFHCGMTLRKPGINNSNNEGLLFCACAPDSTACPLKKM